MVFKKLFVCLAAFGLSTAWAQDNGLKIYISADMEGVTGAVTDEQLGPGGFEYERFRQFMTNEVNAAIDAARAAGATEFVVSDSHGNGQNLLIDQLPSDVTVIRSWPRPLSMMAGIDDTFDGVIFIGYHAGTTNPEGVRAHTMSSTHLADLRINGRSHNEAAINAAIAGNFGVPVIMLSGDDVTAVETTALLGNVETAVVKRAISYHAADTLTPSAGRALIREAAFRAVQRLRDFRPYRVTAPVTVEVRFKNYRPAQMLAYLPMFEMVDAHAVKFTVEDMPTASRVLEFITTYEIGITP